MKKPRLFEVAGYCFATALSLDLPESSTSRIHAELEADNVEDAIYREIPRRLAAFGEVTLHASGVLCNGRAIVAMGRSGLGKSTFANRLGRMAGCEVLADEAVVLRPSDSEGVHVFSYPQNLRIWSGPEKIKSKDPIPQCAGPYPLAAIFLLSPRPQPDLSGVFSEFVASVFCGQEANRTLIRRIPEIFEKLMNLSLLRFVGDCPSDAVHGAAIEILKKFESGDLP